MKRLAATAFVLAAIPAVASGQGYGGQSAPPPQPTAAQPTAQAATPVKLKLSAQAKAAIAALQQAVLANDTAGLPAKIAAAQAVAQTKDDRFAIGELQLKAALATNDSVALAAAVDTLASAQYLEPAKVSGLYKDLGVRQFNDKHFDLAIASFQKAATLAPGDVQATELLGQGMLAGGRPGEAVSVLQRALQARTAAGQKPTEDIYRKAVQAAFDAKSPAVEELARQWLVAYPSAQAWRNTLAIYRNSGQVDENSGLALLRLMRATGGLTNAADYRTYLKAMLDQLNFNEAQAVLDEGIAAQVIDPASADNSALVAAIRGKPKASAADLAAAAQTAQSGTALLKIGDRFYGLGDYAKAADLYRRAQARGVDAATVNLRVGTALARAGDKAGAITALKAVNGSAGGIAKYWLLYLQQPG